MNAIPSNIGVQGGGRTEDEERKGRKIDNVGGDEMFRGFMGRLYTGLTNRVRRQNVQQSTSRRQGHGVNNLKDSSSCSWKVERCTRVCYKAQVPISPGRGRVQVLQA
jgi:hypothetical protein